MTWLVGGYIITEPSRKCTEKQFLRRITKLITANAENYFRIYLANARGLIKIIRARGWDCMGCVGLNNRSAILQKSKNFRSCFSVGLFLKDYSPQIGNL